MNSEIKRTYVIELTEDEARHLKALMQNQFMSDEPKEVYSIRVKIFNCLDYPELKY